MAHYYKHPALLSPEVIGKSALPVQNNDEKAKCHYLFLQGPVGPFFKQLGQALQARGHQVSRINFNAGDWLDWNGCECRAFKKPLSAWRDYLTKLAQSEKVSDLIIYGDCRPLHALAIECLKPLGVRIHVLEEGYIRPNYITYEPCGVNARSHLPKDPSFYLEHPLALNHDNLPLSVSLQGVPKGGQYFSAFLYYAFVYLGAPFFPHYQNHRIWPIFKEGLSWTRRFLSLNTRKRNAYLTQRKLYQKRKKYFLCLLQLCTDSQIQSHSRYNKMTEFMEVIFSDFAANAPKDTSIVIKNHPLDNGMSNVAKACYKLADRYGITDRVIFIDGGRLRGLLRACIGAITVNSTAGLNALDIGKPVKVMGDALYDIKGICDQAELKTFWQNPTPPNMKLYNSFKKCLTLYCLINGSFFSSVGRQLVLDHIERFEQYGIIRNDGQTKLSEQGQKQDIIDVSSNSDKNTFPSDPALRQVS